MSEPIPSTSGIDLYTADTPNGAKISIALNGKCPETLHLIVIELSTSYPDFTYTQHTLDLSSRENKKEWYVKINPNGRIPAIVDRNLGKGNVNVWEVSFIRKLC
jgi:glutathione S-transferase